VSGLGIAGKAANGFNVVGLRRVSGDLGAAVATTIAISKQSPSLEVHVVKIAPPARFMWVR